LLTENDLTEAMRLTEPAPCNQTKKHLLLENFLVYWAKEFPIKNIADSRAQCDSMVSFL